MKNIKKVGHGVRPPGSFKRGGSRRFLVMALVALMIVVTSGIDVEAKTPYKTYTQDGYGRFVETQTAYEPVGSIAKIGDLTLSKAAEMFITKDDVLYIADTGNRRILKATLQGELLQVIGEGDLDTPLGIFVTEAGVLYVADEKKGLIFVYDQAGALMTTYGKPDHPLFGKAATFQPQKVVVDPRGTMYIISKGNNNGIIQISPAEGGSFLGYFGANDTRINFMTLFRKAIFTEEQQARMAKSEPVTIANLSIDDSGLVYTVSQGEQALTLKKMNIAGKNLVFPDVFDQYPAAVVTGPLENIFVASKNGFIYEYNSEGSLLFVFGARDDGKQRVGLFKTVTAIALDSRQRLYVLDEEKNEIQIFKTTEFADLVHEAVELYQNGYYTESKEPWQQVLLMNSLFDYANLGMGEAYFKEGDYDEALRSYRLAKEYGGYSDAFWEVRNAWMKENLVSIFLLLLGLYILSLIGKKLDQRLGLYNPLRKMGDKLKKIQLLRELFFLKYMLKNPADAYYGIRREGKVSYLSTNILLILVFIISQFDKYGTAYLFRYTMDGRYEIVQDAYNFFGLLFLVVICNYLVSTINDGEGRFRDIYQGFIYALAPYIFFKPILIVASHGLTYNEFFIIQFGNFFINAWVIVMLILMIKYINDYTFKETFKIIFYTAFTVLIAILVLFIVYVLMSQVIDFVQSFIGEVVYRIAKI